MAASASISAGLVKCTQPGRASRRKPTVPIRRAHRNVGIEATGTLGVAVSNVPGYAAASVAQTAFGLPFELAIGVGLHDRAVKDGEWCPIIRSGSDPSSRSPG